MKRITQYWRYYLTALIAFYAGGTFIVAHMTNAWNHGISLEQIPEIITWPWTILTQIWQS
jgi:hypothetical protein